MDQPNRRKVFVTQHLADLVNFRDLKHQSNISVRGVSVSLEQMQGS